MPEPVTDLTPAAEYAANLVRGGGTVGLGTGRAAVAFLHALSRKVREGFRVRGVPTSRAAEKLALSLGIPLVSLDDVEQIDVDVDGADEVDPRNQLIKGYGGALVREKIIATAARERFIIVGTEKLVPALGTRGQLPVEVVPFALAFCSREIAKLGLDARPRFAGGELFLSDNGNPILDCSTGPIASPVALEADLRAIPGVVGTGLFLDFLPTIIIQDGGQVVVRPAVTSGAAPTV